MATEFKPRKKDRRLYKKMADIDKGIRNAKRHGSVAADATKGRMKGSRKKREKR